MEAYRDQYATLFNNGRKVVVIGISVDPDTALASWARDSDFPMLFASDTGGAVGRAYGAFDAKNKLDDRSLYVIAPDGTVAYHVRPFRQMVGESYTELGAVVDKLSPPAADPPEQ
jgi:peroxiredoxin Q/BCP